MIPKIIHYCWFGNKPIPDKYKKYMATWKEKCPDFEIKEWNEKNFDVNENQYCKEAYVEKKWAFVSDYARLKIIYENGGIYLDTDVEIIKDLSPLIQGGIGFFGFQNSMEVNSGLGFAAEQGNVCVKAMLDIYNKRHFLLVDGRINQIPCPACNTVGLLKCGLMIGKEASHKIQYLEGIRVYPQEYFNPLDFDTLKLEITDNSYMIHRYDASWVEISKRKKKIKRIIPNWILKYRTILVAIKDIKQIEKEIENR